MRNPRCVRSVLKATCTEHHAERDEYVALLQEITAPILLTGMNDNPYSSSIVEQPPLLASVVTQEPTAREVFIAWEKLRLIFNGVLAVLVLLALGRTLVETRNLEFVLEGAVGANVAYCVGPVCEGYLALLGVPRRGARWFLFVLGTFAGGILAMFALSIHATA